MDNSFIEIVIGLIVGLTIGLVVISIITLIFRWLWNTTMPDVFGLKSLTFVQALKIMLISTMLFGGGTKVMQESHEAVADDSTMELSD
jgi:hypothetical protein